MNTQLETKTEIQDNPLEAIACSSLLEMPFGTYGEKGETWPKDPTGNYFITSSLQALGANRGSVTFRDGVNFVGKEVDPVESLNKNFLAGSISSTREADTIRRGPYTSQLFVSYLISADGMNRVKEVIFGEDSGMAFSDVTTKEGQNSLDDSKFLASLRNGQWPLQVPKEGDGFALSSQESFALHDRDKEAHILEVLAVTPVQSEFVISFLQEIQDRTKGSGELDALLVATFDRLIDTKFVKESDDRERPELVPLDLTANGVISTLVLTEGFSELPKLKKIWVKGIISNALKKSERKVKLDPQRERAEAVQRIAKIVSSLPDACEDLAA